MAHGYLLRVVVGALLVAALMPATARAAAPSAARSAGAWSDLSGPPAAARSGARAQVQARRHRSLALDRHGLAAVLAGAPRERTQAARSNPLTVALPAPDGSFRRFAVQRTSVMEPALAARHPEIATYSGSGIDDRGATVRLDLTPAGFHASVRGPGGSWYVDPYYQRDQSVYASYRGADLANPRAPLLENDVLAAPGQRRAPAAAAALAGSAVSLRTYRLALVSDPAYATYHGAANVTAAKVTLINRVNQIYEDDFAIRLTLVAGNDALNLNTAAMMTGADGPCGAAACYTSAQATSCSVSTLDQTRIVIGQLIGASNYDVGHIGMGTDGGGIAYLGGVGANRKGGGCTGVSTPAGDLFAVDYVAHEIGHQFDANHTFNGIDGSCGPNGADTSVEPGSGVTVMAYAGICTTDDLQPHSDPYFSQRSIDEVSAYVGAAPSAINEAQTVSLYGFSGTDSFTLTYNGVESAPIVRGTNYSSAELATAIQTITGAAVTVRRWDGSIGTLTDSGFSVTFDSGALAASDVAHLSLTSTAGVTGFVGETAQGGPIRNGGSATVTANRAPVVEAPAGFTIPTRTPFALTGSATDADGDALVYLWEQNDAGPPLNGTSLVSNTKPSGPLFGVFGTRATVSGGGTLQTPSPGQNAAATQPARVFPDMAQILAGNTNAATGSCPAAPSSPPVPTATVACYAEFLPTADYAGPLHFRLTARDANPAGGGVAHADTTLTLATAAGPFRVTSQATTTSVQAGSALTVTWSVANTNAPPVSAADVNITLSTDGGLTFPTVLSASTPNDGSEVVTLPAADTADARIKVEALGNVFFDVNRADFTIVPAASGAAPVAGDDAPAGGATAQYSDALAPAVTVTATDADSPGSALSASATGLPAGLALNGGTTTEGPPSSRSWVVGGAVTAAPGTYPVTVTVTDGAGHADVTTFDVVVTSEDAIASYSGDTLVTGAEGAAQAPATLRVTVLDSSAAPAATDLTAGDVANASVTFKRGTTTLCANVPVVTAGAATTGTATCTVGLATGATHHIDAIVGGRYSAGAAGDVEVRATASPSQPQPQPQPEPQPVQPFAFAALAPDLAKVAARLRLSASGRVAVRLACRPLGLGLGLAPQRCSGTLRLTMKIKGKRQTIGTATFRFAPTTTKTVSIRLSAKARRALKRTTAATLAAVVTSADGAPQRATKTVRLVPRKR